MPRPAQIALLAAAAALACSTLPTVGAAPSAAQDGRCTIIGTAHADRLTGTANHDVICGLGGNDLIDGRGGNDVINGGPGTDVLAGGGGTDVLRGGSGHDRLSGGSGSDNLLGGDGADLLAGGTTADHIAGGSGADILAGGSGNDTLAGNGGNDDLNGDAGADALDGGAGTNWCTRGATDTQKACVYDKRPPVADGAGLSTHRVDVSAAGREATARVHVVDDTGVTDVRIGAANDAGQSIASFARLVSGSVRDGWWEAALAVPRWSAPGDLALSVSMTDRVGRPSSNEFPTQVLTVLDAHPDLDPPQVQLLSPTSASRFDVRSAPRDVTIRARITDAVSGVAHADLCLFKPRDGFYGNLMCPQAELVSGDLHDGTWQATVRIPKGDTGGDWNVGVDPVDRAHPNASPIQWMGPDVYRYWTNGGQVADPSVQPLPDGQGRFSVTGTDDSTPASITSLVFTPDHVDTLYGDAEVTVTVHAHDASTEGVTGVGLSLGTSSDPDALSVPPVDLTLTEGTPVDGTWTGTFTLPQGTPPATYWVQAWIEDSRHFRSYGSSGSPWSGDTDELPLPGDAQLTVDSAE